MGTTADKLNKLIESKAAIKAAIEAKGVADVGDVLSEYPSKIASIPSGGTGGKFKVTNDFSFGYSTFTEFDPTQFDFSEKTDMSDMFSYCTALATVQLFDTSNVTDMSGMFNFCRNLTSIPQFDTANVTIMSTMFTDCTNLTTVPLFDTINVTAMRYMFGGCTNLTTVPLFNTSNVTNMYSMFSSCSKLSSIPQFDTSNATDMTTMFSQCKSLTTVPLLDTNKATSIIGIFSNCTSLTTLSGFVGLKANLDLSASEVLTVDSVMNVINNAADMSSSAKTLTLHANVFSQLSEEQIQTAAAKGWNIAQK